jgi:hypothetical protein
MMLFCGLAGHAVAANTPPAVSLCTATENTYLSCETENHKIISMCGALPNALQYRFGRPDKIELRYPEDPSIATSVILLGHSNDTSADRSAVNFTNGSYRYSVFDLRYHNGDRYTGVVAQGKNQVKHKVVCKNEVQGNLDEIGKYLKCDPKDIFNEGLVDDCHKS